MFIPRNFIYLKVINVKKAAIVIYIKVLKPVNKK